jgi:hypothetical protein
MHFEANLSPDGRFYPHTILYGTLVHNRGVQTAHAVEVVLQELTVRQCAFDEAAIPEMGSAEDAVGELALHEIAVIESSPVPVDVLEGAAAEVGVDEAALGRQVFKVAELEVVSIQLDGREVVGVDRL